MKRVKWVEEVKVHTVFRKTGKMVCESCKKSAKRVKKVTRYVICRDCWTDMLKRSKFKALSVQPIFPVFIPIAQARALTIF